MHKITAAIGTLALTFAAPAVQAATITRPFATFGYFSAGPIMYANMGYTLSFDPAAALPTGSISNYAAYTFAPSTGISLNPAFASPWGVLFAPGTITIGKSISGIGAATPGTDDFVLTFNYDSAGKPTGTPNLLFTTSGSDQTYFATMAPTIDAPEPATWALMLLGVGAIGATMRRRKAGRLSPAPYRITYS